VPETRGVALGREMDLVFGAGGRGEGDTEGDEVLEVEEAADEGTALLRGQESVRRGSCGAYT
jgi:hypothetical protein